MPFLIAITLLIVGASVLAQTSNIQPFGLRQGMTIQEVKSIAPTLTQVKGQPFMWQADRLPGGDPSTFDAYLVVVAPKAGFCKLTASGVTRETNAFGHQLKEAFEDMVQVLSVKYGSPKRYEFLTPGSIWDEPNDWMMALLKEERTHAAIWFVFPDLKETDYKQAGISLKVEALSSSKGYISVAYEFPNWKACRDETNASRTNPW